MRRILVCLAIGMLTGSGLRAVGYGRMFLRIMNGPAHGAKLPPLLSGSQLAGPMFQYPAKGIYVDAAKVPMCCTSCLLLPVRPAHGHTSLHSALRIAWS